MNNIDLSLLNRIGARIDNGGEPPDDGDMEARISKLEHFVVDARERLTKIETRLDQTATKADVVGTVGALQVEMHKGFADMIKWVVGTGVLLGVAAITVMTFVLNNAVPKSLVAQPAPIIIYAQPSPVGPAQPPAPPKP